MPSPQAEHLEFLVHLLRFARFYILNNVRSSPHGKYHSLQNTGVVHESVPFDVHIGEKVSVLKNTLHDNEVPSITIHMISAKFRLISNLNICTLYFIPTSWESQPLVAVDNFG